MADNTAEQEAVLRKEKLKALRAKKEAKSTDVEVRCIKSIISNWSSPHNIIVFFCSPVLKINQKSKVL
jgi:hypothetical protein